MELARYRCLGCEAAVIAIPGLSRGHSEPSGTRVVTAMSAHVALSDRVRRAHERMSRNPSGREADMKK